MRENMRRAFKDMPVFMSFMAWSGVMTAVMIPSILMSTGS